MEQLYSVTFGQLSGVVLFENGWARSIRDTVCGLVPDSNGTCIDSLLDYAAQAVDSTDCQYKIVLIAKRQTIVSVHTMAVYPPSFRPGSGALLLLCLLEGLVACKGQETSTPSGYDPSAAADRFRQPTPSGIQSPDVHTVVRGNSQSYVSRGIG